MRTSEHRIGAYGNKVAAEGTEERYTAIILAQQSSMRDGYAAFAEAIVPELQAVQQILDDASIVRILRGGYYAFAGELFKLRNTMSGAGVAAEVAAIHAKWVARGLTTAVLTSIEAQFWPA